MLQNVSAQCKYFLRDVMAPFLEILMTVLIVAVIALIIAYLYKETKSFIAKLIHGSKAEDNDNFVLAGINFSYKNIGKQAEGDKIPTTVTTENNSHSTQDEGEKTV
jgi:uncharacterized membrane protein YraQ (UPF0718 family)